MKRIYQILLTGFIFAGIIACENETKVCDQTLRNDLHIHFKRDSANGAFIRDTIMPKVTALALKMDTIYKKQPLSDIYFQLSPVSDSSKFYLQVDSTAVADTLTFKYSRVKHFISPGCGFGTYFNLDTVLTTKHTIGYIQINNKSVTSSNDTHLLLYFIVSQ